MKTFFQILGWVLAVFGLVIAPHIDIFSWKWSLPMFFTGLLIAGVVALAPERPKEKSDDPRAFLIGFLFMGGDLFDGFFQILISLGYIMFWLIWLGIYVW